MRAMTEALYEGTVGRLMVDFDSMEAYTAFLDSPVFPQQVFVHKVHLAKNFLQEGDAVRFSVHVNKEGKPQASFVDRLNNRAINFRPPTEDNKVREMPAATQQKGDPWMKGKGKGWDDWGKGGGKDGWGAMPSTGWLSNTAVAAGGEVTLHFTFAKQLRVRFLQIVFANLQQVSVPNVDNVSQKYSNAFVILLSSKSLTL